jgi:hypothetical protein
MTKTSASHVPKNGAELPNTVEKVFFTSGSVQLSCSQMKLPNHLRTNFISDFLFIADDATCAQLPHPTPNDAP